MPAIESLCHLIGINPQKLSKAENQLVEAELFFRLCEELQTWFMEQYKDFFQLIKFDKEKEDAMLEATLISNVINDILSTEEYTLSGIASYTQMPEDIIYEIVIGKNTCPSLALFRKIIELHRKVRSNLYREMMRKIVLEYSAAA